MFYPVVILNNSVVTVDVFAYLSGEWKEIKFRLIYYRQGKNPGIWVEGKTSQRRLLNWVLKGKWKFTKVTDREMENIPSRGNKTGTDRWKVTSLGKGKAWLGHTEAVCFVRESARRGGPRLGIPEGLPNDMVIKS